MSIRCIALAIALTLGVTSAQARDLMLGISEGTSGGTDHARVVQKYGGLAEAIGKAIKADVKVVFVREFAQLEDGMKSSRLDLVLARPSDYPARGLRDYGYRYVASVKPEGQCLIVVPKDSPIRQLADLKGKKIGVTAPGSSTAMMASYVLAKAGLKASDVSFIGVGASSGAIAAVKSGQVDAIANLDPVITMLQRDNLIKVVADTRTLKDTQAVYGGPMPAACLYTPVKFVQDNPGTTQALANAMVRALRWLQKAGPSDIVKTVPDSYLLGDRALYLAAWERVREAISPDGLMPEAGPATALRMLQTFEDSLKDKPIDLGKTYTNNFARKAAAKYG